MQHVVANNNDGVNHIRSGRYKEAKKAFKIALSHLVVLLDEQPSEDSQRMSPLRVETRSLPQSLDPSSCSNTFYLYRDAYVAYVDPTLTSGQTVGWDQNAHCMTVLITFNLSLALHYQADIDDGEMSLTHRYKKVLSLYKKTLKALQLATIVTSWHQAYQDTITLAILNNTGMIYFHVFSNYRKAKHYLESLKNILSFDRCDSVAEMIPDAFNGLMMNVFVWEEQFGNSEYFSYSNPRSLVCSYGDTHFL